MKIKRKDIEGWRTKVGFMRFLNIIKDGIRFKWCFTQWWLVFYDFIRHPNYTDYPFAYTDDLSPTVIYPECVKKVIKQFVLLQPGIKGRQHIWFIRS